MDTHTIASIRDMITGYDDAARRHDELYGMIDSSMHSEFPSDEITAEERRHQARNLEAKMATISNRLINVMRDWINAE